MGYESGDAINLDSCRTETATLKDRKDALYSIAFKTNFTIFFMHALGGSGAVEGPAIVMNSFASTSLLARSAHAAVGRSGVPVRLPQKFDIRDAHFDELELRLEEQNRALWCDMRPRGRPSATYEMMNDIGALQATVRQLFIDLPPGARTPFDYFVFGSKIPGIYNLGGDLDYFVQCIRARDFEAMRHYGHTAVQRQFESSQAFGAPVITMTLVRGDALGGGFEFALSFDVIVAERSARMGLPEVLFNLFPGMGAYSFLSRKLDRRQAEKFIMSGRIYTGEELYELGVVDVLAEDGEGENAVREYIAQHSRKFTMHRAVYEARRRINPVTMQELLDVVDLWAETAMKLEERDLRIMERLSNAQDKRVSGTRDEIRLVRD
jgi:DSF synthase